MRSFKTAIDRKDWNGAAGALQRIGAAFPNAVIRAEPRLYRSASRYVRDLAKLFPPEGLKKYRQTIDPQAKKWLEQAQATQDPEPLRQILAKTPLSSYETTARLRLAEAEWQAGNLDSAYGHWKSLADDKTIDRASLLARLALCEFAMGDAVAAAKRLQILKQQYANSKGRLAGRTGTWVRLLEERFRRGWRQPAIEDSSRSFAKSAERNSVFPGAPDLGAIRWRIAFSTGRQHEPNSHPVVSNGRLFVTNGNEIFAFDLKTGKPAFPTGAKAASTLAAARVFPDLPTRITAATLPIDGGFVHTLSLSRDRIFARIGSPITGVAPAELRTPTSGIVCIPLSSLSETYRPRAGQRQWSRDSGSLSKESGWMFDGTPVVVDGRVFVSATQRKQDLKKYVICLDAADGKTLWTRFVYATTSPVDEKRHTANPVLLTAGNGMIFLAAGEGAIAAIDQATGRLEWMRTYPRATPRAECAPPVFHRECVFVAPIDSNSVFAIDSESGRLRWSFTPKQPVRHVLGVAAGNVIVSGKSVWAINATTGKLAWRRLVKDPEFGGLGRGFLTPNALWWPTREKILRLSLRNGQPLSPPKDLRYRKGRGGHLIPHGKHLVVVETSGITVYSNSAGRLPVPKSPLE